MAAPADERPWIAALLIGELPYMTTLNAITTRITEHAVELWRQRPDTLLICECDPMAAVARRLGVPGHALRVAIPEPAGHTTWWAASRIAAMPDAANRALVLVTHRLHGRRAARMFRRQGFRTTLVGLDLPFDAQDPDWKLRSEGLFRVYNAMAWVYCAARGWV
jgi:hypothetical protein